MNEIYVLIMIVILLGALNIIWYFRYEQMNQEWYELLQQQNEDWKNCCKAINQNWADFYREKIREFKNKTGGDNDDNC